MGFNDEQLKAIETVDRSVLVSAAAGSGKTTVLIERIIRIILEGRANVDEMLVVTFTNAAASEMRLRLARAIRDRIREHPEDAARMRDQLSRLYRAYISTMNSFAGRVIKEFFHETDLEPQTGVCDEVTGELLRREAAADLLEDAFADDSIIEGGSFREFMRLYSSDRNDTAFTEGLLKSYEALRTMPDYFEWALEKAELLRVTKDSFEGSELQKMITDDARAAFGKIMEGFARLREIFDEAGLSDWYEEKILIQEDAVHAVLSELNRRPFAPDMEALIDAYPSVILRAGKDRKEAYEPVRDEIKSIRDNIKKQIEGFKNRYLLPDFETRLEEMNATYGYTVYYIRLLGEFEKRYEAKKRERKVMDFADQEHCAVQILKNDDAAEVMRKRFRYIFVDEYQDTNNIQERLISRVSRPDNVFRVGDVKQSIYRFRQAEPAIFERLYAKYSDPDERDGMVIDLGMNFRTNDRTIRYINHVFDRIMEGYDENARLYTGIRDCPDEYDFMPEVHLLIEDGDSGEEEEISDPEIDELSKEEAEAAYIADLAASIIGTEFYDTATKTVRRAEARDIAILLRAVSVRGEIVSRALRERSIEPHIEDSEDYFDTVEISIAMSLLQCIDNMKRDVPFIAVLHSEVFGFGPEELARIRIDCGDRRIPYWDAFARYAKDGPAGELRDRVAAAESKMLEWRMLSRMLPLDDFVWKVLVDSGYYRMAGAMSGGARRQANLRYLADRAAAFSKDRVASLSTFITFLDVLRSKKIKNTQTSMAGRDDNVVRISTIHKSKGLEFPFVIVGGLGHRFNFSSNEMKFSFSSDIGVGMPYVDPQRRFWRSTLLQRAITEDTRRDEYREELRLLYVAMTRARNRLLLTGTVKSEEELTKYAPNPGNYLKAMQDVLRSGFNTYTVSPLVLKMKRTESSARGGRGSLAGRELTADGKKLYDEIDRRFSYRYPYEEDLTAKAKWSVSAVRKEELGKAKPSEETETDVKVSKADDEIVRLWDSNERRKRASAADIGIAYHRIMEFIDFSRVCDEDGIIDEAYIAERAEFLRDRGAIEEDVYRSLDLSKAADFFAMDIGQRAVRAAKAGTLRKEKPFTLKTARGGREMLVQGVIDCCFEEDGKMILVDYKSNYMDPRRPREEELARLRNEYGVQIELYSEAIRKGSGKEVAEAYLWLFAADEALAMM